MLHSMQYCASVRFSFNRLSYLWLDDLSKSSKLHFLPFYGMNICNFVFDQKSTHFYGCANFCQVALNKSMEILTKPPIKPRQFIELCVSALKIIGLWLWNMIFPKSNFQICSCERCLQISVSTAIPTKQDLAKPSWLNKCSLQ